METTGAVQDSLEADEALYLALETPRSDEALSALLGRHWTGCYRVALAIVRDPASAEDAAQEAFVRVIRAARKGVRVESFSPWLRTVVVNEARMLLRARRRRTRHEEASAMKKLEVSGAAGAIEAVREYAATLPEKLRVPLLLHFGLGLSHAEVAEALGVPKPTASTRIQTGVARLRASLAGAGFALPLLGDELFAQGLFVGEAPAPAAPGPTAIRGRVASRRSWLARALPAPSVVAVVLAVLGGVSLALPSGLERLHGVSAREVATESSANGLPGGEPTGASVSGERTPAIALGRGSVATVPSESAATAAAAPAPWDEIEPVPPAYPWPRPEPVDPSVAAVQQTLDRRRVTLNFDQTPIEEAFAFLGQCGVPKITIDGEAKAIIEQDAPKVDLRLRSIGARWALDLVLAVDQKLDSEVGPDGVTIVAAREREWVRRPPFAWVPSLVSGSRDDQWKLDYRKKIESQRVTFHFAETPLSEVVNFLIDITGINFTVSKAVDVEQVKVTLDADDQPLGEALRGILAAFNLVSSFKNESVLIGPPAEDGEDHSHLAAKRVSLDLRGVQVVDLIRALERQGVTAVCSEATWESRGTFSFVAVDEPLDQIAADLKAKTPLSAWIEEDAGELDEDGHGPGVFVIGGAVASVRAALVAPVPDYAGVAADIAACRARLQLNAPARHAARAERETPLATLDALERRVSADAERVAALLGRVTRVESARARASVLEARQSAALARARDAADGIAALASESAPDAARAGELGVRQLVAQGDLDEIRPDLAAARADLWDLEALERGERLSFGVHAAHASPTFYFLGGKLTNRRFTRADLERAIVGLGGRVVRDLDPAELPRLDYVVVLLKGEEDDKNYAGALDLGATIVTEPELVASLPGLVHQR